MRFVPDWTGSWLERLMAMAIGLFLVAGLALAIHRRSWIVVLVWLVLFSAALVPWVLDLLKAKQRKN
jgi:hypothetical protein